jgi:secreted Zn-dependent insulinase-like peptidase
MVSSRRALSLLHERMTVAMSSKNSVLTSLLFPIKGKFLCRIPVGNAENSNSAIEQFTYIGDIYDDLERAKLSVFATIVQEPLFDDLRAKQQLGYIVSLAFRLSASISETT